MKNTLFAPDLISDRVTGSDALFGTERARNHFRRLVENPVTTCHLSLIADAVILKADLERRGVSLGTFEGAVVCDGEANVIDRFAEQIVRCKRGLLHLFEADVAPAHPSWRDRTPKEWTAANGAVSPGAGAICATLRDFEPLLRLVRANRLPLGPVRVEVTGRESFVIENAAVVVGEVEAAWTKRARDCARDRRLLTSEEGVALRAASARMVDSRQSRR